MNKPASFAPLLERFFIQRLMQQRQASPHTISSYRDTFRQFLKFAQQRLHKQPSRMIRGNRRPVDRRVSGRPGEASRLEYPQPESASNGDSLLLSLRGARDTSAFRADPAGTRHTQQAFYPHPGAFPDASRSRCLARCAGSAYLVWQT